MTMVTWALLNFTVACDIFFCCTTLRKIFTEVWQLWQTVWKWMIWLCSSSGKMQVFEVEHLHISIFTTSWQQEIHWAACMQLNWMYCHSHCDCKFLEKGQQCPFCKNYAEKKWKIFLPFVNIFHENCYLEVTSMMVPMCSPFQLIMICHDLISTFTLKKFVLIVFSHVWIQIIAILMASH